MFNRWPNHAWALALVAVLGGSSRSADAGEVAQTTFAEAESYREQSLFVRQLSAGVEADQIKLEALKLCAHRQEIALNAALGSGRSSVRDYRDHQRAQGKAAAKFFALNLIWNFGESGRGAVADPMLDRPILPVEIPTAQGGTQQMFTLTAYVDSHGECRVKSANEISDYFALLSKRMEETVGQQAASGFFAVGDALNGLKAVANGAGRHTYGGAGFAKLVAADASDGAKDSIAARNRAVAGSASHSEGGAQRRPGFSAVRIAPQP